MEFNALVSRAMAIRRSYAAYEQQAYGRSWTGEEVVLGLVGDVGDLAKLILAAEGVRDIPDYKSKLAHELADCLWATLVLSEIYGVDLESVFQQSMAELEGHITAQGPA